MCWVDPADSAVHMGHAGIILLSQTTSFLAQTSPGIIPDEK